MGMHWGKGLFSAFLCYTGKHWDSVPGCNAVVSPNSKRWLTAVQSQGHAVSLIWRCFPDALLTAAPLCRLAMDLFLACAYQGACVVYILTKKSCIYWWKERGDVCAVDVCLLFPLPFSLKLSDVACATWCKCIHVISQSCQLLSGLPLSCLGPGSVSGIPRHPAIQIHFQTIFRQWWQSNI